MSHTESLRVPAGTAISEPQPDFHTASLSRTFIQRAPAGLPYSGPRPGFHTAGPSRALIRQIPTGPLRSPLTPSVSEPHPSVSQPHPGFIRRDLPDCLGRTIMSQGPSRVFIRRALVGPSDQSTSLSRALRPVGWPQSCFHWRTPVFIRLAQAGALIRSLAGRALSKALIQRPGRAIGLWTQSGLSYSGRRTSAGVSRGGPKPGLIRRAPAGLLDGRPRLGPQMVDTDWAFKRRALAGSQSVGLGRALIWRASTEPSYGGGPIGFKFVGTVGPKRASMWHPAHTGIAETHQHWRRKRVVSKVSLTPNFGEI